MEYYCWENSRNEAKNAAHTAVLCNVMYTCTLFLIQHGDHIIKKQKILFPPWLLNKAIMLLRYTALDGL